MHTTSTRLNPALPSRRNVLRSALFGFSAAAVTPAIASALAKDEPPRQETPRSSRRLLRVAHITDIHVEPERNAPTGLRQTLEHVHALGDRPDLIITGGDLVMDTFATTDVRAALQWELFTSIFEGHCTIPVRHCLGNHDIWGWDKKASHTDGSEATWGKRRALESLGLEKAYYTFSVSGVTFVVLDSVQPHGETGYAGGLDDAQFAWLTTSLAEIPAGTPVVILSHIPILHAGLLLLEGTTTSDGRTFGSGSSFLDAVRVTNLFERFPNIRVALSGHIHSVERLEYKGIAYINSGAVSGAWWKSQETAKVARHADTAQALTLPALHADPGYSIVDIFANGAIEWNYVTTGWVGET